MMTDNIYYYEPREPRGRWTEDDCLDCHGNGFDGDGYPCKACDNTGYVEVWVDYDPDDYDDDR